MAVEPIADPKENTFMDLDHFLWEPESNAKNVNEFFETIKDNECDKTDRSLLLNWCYPNPEYENYDFKYIDRLRPFSIFSISAGVESQETKQKNIYFCNIIQYLFQKNIKYENLKEISKFYFKDKKLGENFLKNGKFFLEKEDNFDNIEIDPSIILEQKYKKLFDMQKCSQLDNYITNLQISYDILFYLNKYLLHFINKYNRIFTNLRPIILNESKLLNRPPPESMIFNSIAGGELFNKFLDDVDKQKKKTFGGNNYNIIKSIKKKINIYVDCNLIDIIDINFVINFIVKKNDFPIKPKSIQEIENNKNTIIEFVLYSILIKINYILLEKVNDIYSIIYDNIFKPAIIKKFNENFGKYNEILKNFYDFKMFEDSPAIYEHIDETGYINSFIFNRGNSNYISVLGVV